MTIRGIFGISLIACAVVLYAGAGFAVSVTKLDDSGPGSLRQAIADTAAGGTVDFSVKGTIKLTGGELVIDKGLVIAGPGSGSVSVSGNKSSRVFNITSGDVTISGLTICDGKATGGPARGGGIYNNGKLTLKSVLFKGNEAVGNAGQCGYGGAIYNNAPLVVAGCVITGNAARGGDGTAGGNGARGGGICTVAAMTLAGSTIAGNTAAGGNSSGPGRAGDGEGGGLFIYNNCTVAVDACTIAANVAKAGNSSNPSGQAGFASGGGAIQNWGGATGARTYTNCTFSGNTCEGGTGGMADSCARGGGAWETSTAQFIHCTFTLNKAAGRFQEGGGLFSAASAGEGPVIQGSIFSGNSAMSGPDLRGNIRSQDFNLVGNATGFTLAGAATQNILGKDPKLGALGNHGGSTQTHLLSAGSPAVDVIPPANCPVKTDQRGVARPSGANCDIGAVETDSAPPAATAIAPVPATTANSKNAAFTVTFSEDVKNFNDAADLIVKETGTVSHTGVAIKGGPKDYTVELAGIKGNGAITLAVNTKSDVQDVNGNPVASSPVSAPFSVDNLPPSITAIAPATPSPTSGDKVAFQVSFSEPVQKFDSPADLAIAKTGSVAYGAVAIAGGPQNYTVSISDINGDGTLAIALSPKSDVRDLPGNPASSTTTSPAITIDHTPLSATLTATTPSPTNADAITFGVAFSKPVGTSFTTETIDLTGTLATAVTSQIGGADPSYTLTVTPSDPNANGDLALGLKAGVADTAGNPLGPIAIGPRVVVDNVPPSATIAPVGSAVTSADSAAFALTFSEPVAPSFTQEDLALTGTLASAATVQLGGADPAYTATVTPNDPNANGTLGVIVGTAVTDLAGNAMAAPVMGPLETFDNVPPTVAVSAVTPTPANADKASFSVVFSKVVAPTFATEDIALTGTLAAAATAQIGGTDPSYAVDVTMNDPNADGTIGIIVNSEIADQAGNKLAAGASSPLITLDNQPITAKVTPSSPSITSAASVEYKVELSQALPKPLLPDSIILTGSLAGAASALVTGEANTFTITVTPTDPAASGTIGVSFAPTVTSAAGNPVNIVGTPPQVSVDRTPLLLAITPVTPTPTRAHMVAFNLAFSKPVAPSFALDDITLAGTLAPNATVQLASADPGYTVVITPNDPAASGTIGFVVGTAVSDAAGNVLSQPVPSPLLTIDNTAPEAKIDLLTPDPVAAAALAFGVTFSEPVAPTFNTDNLALTGTLSSDSAAQISGADPAYTVTVTPGDPRTSGTLGITVGAGVYDAAGNTFPGATSGLYTK